MAQRRETDAEKRRREVADSLEYATRAERDPDIARKSSLLAADMTAGGLDPKDEIRYEDVLARLRGFEHS